VAKQVAQANILFCCLQEVRYRNTGKKIINLDTGESFYFFWCGQKKRRDDKGVGILIRRKCKDLIFDEPDFADPRIMALNIEIKGFKARLVSAYAPTDCDGSPIIIFVYFRLPQEVPLILDITN
jgi:exonuclease III